MRESFPYPFFHDDVAIDISFVFEDEKPAGKHGFLKTNGRRFVFEDGTEVRFWGVNFNGASCFPEHNYAEKVARRLAKTGVNLVRFHQLDAQWHTPNIFAFTKGKRITNGHLDPKSMECLDYLVYCLKNEGIYVYLDMLTYRRFRSDEGVENTHLLGDSAKPYSSFSRKLIELQKEFCKEIWGHYNPYTKLKYCDDPVFVLTEITNECELFSTFGQKDYIEPYKSEFLSGLEAWLKKNGSTRGIDSFSLFDNEDRELLEYKTELQKNYYIEMMTCMKEAGVKIPIAGTNWLKCPSNHHTQLVCDFLDTHLYNYDWKWREFEKHCSNVGIVQKPASYLANCGFVTDANKPTYISEWDMPWPNERRAESVLHTAALGAFQGWSGFAVHAYAYSARLKRMGILGKEFSCEKLADIPYRQGIFSTWNDPAKFGLFYHAALITRRGDVSEGKTLYGYDNGNELDWHHEVASENIEKYKFVCDFNGAQKLPPLPQSDGGIGLCSDTGELYRDYEKELGVIDTPKTKCAYGSLGHNPNIQLNGLRMDCKTDYAVIAMSSLTDDSLENSDNILLTTVGRAENTDAKFSGDLMTELGKSPVLCENIRADIELVTSYSDMKIYSISAEGFYIGMVPATYEDGKLKFSLGNVSRSIYYLITRD